MGNFIEFLAGLSGDAEEWKKKQSEKYDKMEKHRFNIGGKSSFKWKSESSNKTWIENGNIIKEKKGKTIPKY